MVAGTDDGAILARVGGEVCGTLRKTLVKSNGVANYACSQRAGIFIHAEKITFVALVGCGKNCSLELVEAGQVL